MCAAIDQVRVLVEELVVALLLLIASPSVYLPCVRPIVSWDRLINFLPQISVTSNYILTGATPPTPFKSNCVIDSIMSPCTHIENTLSQEAFRKAFGTLFQIDEIIVHEGCNFLKQIIIVKPIQFLGSTLKVLSSRIFSHAMKNAC